MWTASVALYSDCGSRCWTVEIMRWGLNNASSSASLWTRTTPTSCSHALAAQSSHTSNPPHTHTCISVLHSVGRHLSSPCLNGAGPTQPICVDLSPSPAPRPPPSFITYRGYVSISCSLKDYCYRCSVPLLHQWQAAARWEHRFEIDAWDLHIPLPGCLCASEVRRSSSICNSSWAWASEVGSDFDEEKQNAAPLVISEEQTEKFFCDT